MSWNTHSDLKNRAYASLLTSLFPEQTKTVPRIIIWSIVFLLDLCLVVFCAVHFGLMDFAQFTSMRNLTLPGILLLAVLFCIFWLQGFLWYSIVKLSHKRNELG